MNGYFQLEIRQNGTYLRVVPPTEGGTPVGMTELMEYLQCKSVVYDVKALNAGVMSVSTETLLFLNPQPRYADSEMFGLQVSPDKMAAVVRFYPPSNGGAVMGKDEIIRDLDYRGIKFGIDTSVIGAFLEERHYCTDYLIAVGKSPRNGKDAVIEYYFNQNINTRPTLNEDGTVDFYNLNTINHCEKGDIIARLFPEDPGEPGRDVFGEPIKQRDVKKAVLKYSNNINISEDKTILTAAVSGHVMLVEDKVFVSNIYEVENVDNSTGNITYEGSVHINGNVTSNFSIKAKGNVEIKGVVEGATIDADGDIILARGMNGMGKGTLTAGGNVISKFLENATVTAGGYIETDSILHCVVSAKTDVNVTSKKGFITGGVVSATNSVSVRTLGSPMGADTIVEIGVDPNIKERYQKDQKEVVELQKTIAAAKPIMEATAVKLATGVRVAPEQIKYVQKLAIENTKQKKRIEELLEDMAELQKVLDSITNAQVIINGEVYSGTKIVIGDTSMVVQETMKYCRFVRQGGAVKMVAIN